jgi:hypothetical protein
LVVTLGTGKPNCPANSEIDAEETAGETMVDRSGLRLVGFIFASVTFAAMMTATIIVKRYSDGVYSLESAAISRGSTRSFERASYLCANLSCIQAFNWD